MRLKKFMFEKSRSKILLCYVMVLALLVSTFVVFSTDIGSVRAAATRPLVGVVCYNAWQGGLQKDTADVVSLTPPKWSHRLPYFASVTNDPSRLVRTSNTSQEIVYSVSYEVTGIVINAAFDDAESISPSNDIKIYTSPDNSTYTQYTPRINTINYAPDWQKVTYTGFTYGGVSTTWIPFGTKYVKIVINKTDGTVSNPQIMRVEINYRNSSSEHPNKLRIVDDMNDFTKMFSHTSYLTFATNNIDKYRLVTGDEYVQQRIDEQILYAKTANIDYFSYVSGTYFGASGNLAIDLHRSSQYKDDVKYCIILCDTLFDVESLNDRINRYVDYFMDSNYVKVCGGRPLVYLFNVVGKWTDAQINSLCTASVSAGAGDPYLVSMTGAASYVDAGGTYLPGGAGVSINYASTPYTIPCVGFGINYGPRIDNPPPWGSGSQTQAELNGSQMAALVHNGIQWCYDNESKVPSWSILINTWNEFAESAAWICPVRDPTTGNPDTSRLNAVGNEIMSWESPPTYIVNDDFNSMTTGSAPTGWTCGTAGGTVAVQEIPNASDKSIKINDTSSSAGTDATKNFTATGGIVNIEYSVRAEQTNQLFGATYFYDSAGTIIGDVYFNSDGSIYAHNGATGTSLSTTYTAGSFYNIKMVLNTDTDKYDIYVNGVLKASQFNFRNSVSNVAKLYYFFGTTPTGTMYMDNVKVYQ